jgi:hypothetical protein
MIGCRMSVAATVAFLFAPRCIYSPGLILDNPSAVSGLRRLAFTHVILDELLVLGEGSDTRVSLSTGIRVPGQGRAVW